MQYVTLVLAVPKVPAVLTLLGGLLLLAWLSPVRVSALGRPSPVSFLASLGAFLFVHVPRYERKETLAVLIVFSVFFSEAFVI